MWLLAVLACTEPLTLAPVEGRVAWMEPGYRGFVTVSLAGSEAAVGVLRQQVLAEDGKFAFPDLPLGDVSLDVYVRVGTWACTEETSGVLGAGGLDLVLESWEWCDDTGYE